MNDRDAGVTCLLTIHGIGFQQPPDDNRAFPGMPTDSISTCTISSKAC